MRIHYKILILILSLNILTACQSPKEIHKEVQLNNAQIITLPKGYNLSKTIKGDLNKDDIKDFAFLIQKIDSNNWEWSDIQQKKVNKNRRGLVVYLSEDEYFVKKSENLGLFYSENEEGGAYFLPEIMTEIKNQTLKIHFYHGRYGAWNYTFRWQNNGFHLIGYDNLRKSDYQDDIAIHFDEFSYNFLIHKKQTKTVVGYDIEKDSSIYNEQWKTLPKKTLIKLSEIKKLEDFEVE